MGRRVKSTAVKPFVATPAPARGDKAVSEEVEATISRDNDNGYGVTIGFTVDRRHVVVTSMANRALLNHDEIISINGKPVKTLTHSAVLRHIRANPVVDVVAARYPPSHPKRRAKMLSQTSLLSQPKNTNHNHNGGYVPGAIHGKHSIKRSTRDEKPLAWSSEKLVHDPPSNDLNSEIQKALAIQAKLKEELSVWSEIDSHTQSRSPSPNKKPPSATTTAWSDDVVMPQQEILSESSPMSVPKATEQPTKVLSRAAIPQTTTTPPRATTPRTTATRGETTRGETTTPAAAKQTRSTTSSPGKDYQQALADAEARVRGALAARDAAMQEATELKTQVGHLTQSQQSLSAKVSSLESENEFLEKEKATMQQQFEQEKLALQVQLKRSGDEGPRRRSQEPQIPQPQDSFLDHEAASQQEEQDMRTITIPYEEKGMGIDFTGPSIQLHDDSDHDINGFFISEVVHSGASFIAGARQGDRVLTVNGKSIENLLMVNVIEAISKLWQEKKTVTLQVINATHDFVRHVNASKIKRELSQKKSPVQTRRQHESRKITIVKDSAGQIGFSLIGSNTTNERGVHVKAVVADSPAGRAGLAVSDCILAVGEPEVICEGLSYSVIARMIKNCKSKVVLRVIDDEAGHLSHEDKHKESQMLVLNPQQQQQQQQQGSAVPAIVVTSTPTSAANVRKESTTSANTPLLIPDLGATPMNQEKTQLTVTLTRPNMETSLGFGIGMTKKDEHVVFTVQTDGPADSVLFVDDRLLKVNGKNVDGLPHADVVALVGSQLTCTLTLERGAAANTNANTNADADAGGTVLASDLGASSSTDATHFTFTLFRASMTSTYGFGFGSTEEGDDVVTSVRRNTPADGKLNVGDVILTVNQKLTKDLAHEDVISEIIKSDRVEISVEREDNGNDDDDDYHAPIGMGIGKNPTISTVQPGTTIKGRVDDLGLIEEHAEKSSHIDVTLTRATLDSSYGFVLGTNAEGEDYIVSVSKGTPSEGKLQVNDVVVSVGGRKAAKLNHRDLVEAMMKGLSTTWVVRRDGGVPTSLDVTVEDVAITLTRQTASTSWGFGLGSTTEGEDLITSVKEGTPASGSLIPHDHIISANGVPAANMSHTDLIGVISKGLTLTLVVNRLSNARLSFSGVVGGGGGIPITLTRANETISYGLTIGSMTSGGQIITEVVSGSPSDGKLEVHDEILTVNGESTRGWNREDLVAKTTQGTTVAFTVGRAPHMTTTLVRPTMQASFGFALASSIVGNDRVASVVANGPADGKLEVSDMIVAVNGKRVKGAMTHDDLVDHITSGVSVTLEVQRPTSPEVLALLREGTTSATMSGRDDNIGRARTVIVTLKRPDTKTSFGFGLGTTDSGTDVITSVDVNTAADGVLEVYDHVVSVNGAAATNMGHTDIIAAITSGVAVTMEVVRALPTTTTIPAATLNEALHYASSITAVHPGLHLSNRVDHLGKAETVIVTLARPNTTTSFGFGMSSTAAGDDFVDSVGDEGPATGKLRVGDKIVRVNGVSTQAMSHDDVVKHATAGVEVTIEVQRQLAAPHDANANADGDGGKGRQVTVTLRRADLVTSYGFGIGSRNDGTDVITNISAETPAAGVLQVNDRVTSVNGTSVKDLSHQDIVRRVSSGLEVTLDVWRSLVETELVTTTLQRPDVVTSYGFGVGTTNVGNDVVTSVGENTPADGKLEVNDTIVAVNGVSSTDMSHEDLVESITCGVEVTMQVQRLVTGLALKPRARKRESISTVNPALQIVGRVDDLGRARIVSVTLTRVDDKSGYGFGVGSTNKGNDMVTAVADGGPAQGKLEVGDMIVGVNGVSAKNMTHDIVVSAITHGVEVRLDVKRSIVPRLTTKVVTATLQRPDVVTSFGFGVGKTNLGNDVVTTVGENTPADGKLEVNDTIVAVNGVSTNGLSHDDLIEHITSGVTAVVQVQRSQMGVAPKHTTRKLARSRPSISTVNPALQIVGRVDDLGRARIVSVTLTRADERSGYGFGVGSTNKGNDMVTAVAEDGPADSKLEVGDMIVGVNGESAEHMTHDDIVAAITHGVEVRLDVKRSWQKTEPVTVTLQRPDTAASYGFGIGTTNKGNDMVTSIAEDGPAQGKLAVDDMIVGVNGVSAKDMSHEDIVAAIGKGMKVTVDVRRPMSMATSRALASKGGDDGVDGDVETLTVALSRPSTSISYGFGIATTDKGNDIITAVGANTPADGKLEIDDMVVGVNGVSTEGMSHTDIIAVVSGGVELVFEVQRPKPIADFGKTERMTVTVTRPDTGVSYGFGIATTNKGNDIITKVDPNTPADGKLEEQDMIVGVNGVSATNMSHNDIIAAVSSSLQVTFDIDRFQDDDDAKEKEEVSRTQELANKSKSIEMHDRIRGIGSNATNEISVTLIRKDNKTSYGFGLVTTDKNTALVASVVPNTPADGKLEVKDIIVGINRKSAMDLDHAQIVQEIINGLTVTIVVKRETSAVSSSQSTGQRASISNYVPNLTHLSNRVDNLGSPTSAPTSRSTTTTTTTIAEADEGDVDVNVDVDVDVAADAAIDFKTVGEGPLLAQKVVSFTLTRANESTSYGFGLGATLDGANVITKVVEDSPAGGKLEERDVMVAINGQQTDDMSHAAIVAVIKHGLSVTIAVARDSKDDDADDDDDDVAVLVAVTLVRATDTTSYGFGLAENTISLIKPGGIAAGNLFAGDVIVAVNGASIHGFSHADVVAKLMQGVTVSIDVDRCVPRSVELKRGGGGVGGDGGNGSMGISICGPEVLVSDGVDPVDFIFISGTSEDALNVGDHVLAVDDIPTEGRTLSQVEKQISVASSVKLQVVHDMDGYNEQQELSPEAQLDQQQQQQQQTQPDVDDVGDADDINAAVAAAKSS